MKEQNNKPVNKAIIISAIILVLILIAGLSFGQEINPDLSTIEKSNTLRTETSYAIILIVIAIGLIFSTYKLNKLLEYGCKKRKEM